MSNNTNTQVSTQQPTSIKALMSSEAVMSRLNEILGKRAATFSTSVIQIVQSTDALKKAEPQSVLNAALVAATLDLPLNNNLGFAYIVPYGAQAQFQLGVRGIKQLAQRSGQYKFINQSDVKQGELKSWDRLTGEIVFEWEQDFNKRESLPTVGYVSYFELQNGFSSTFYMTVEQLEKHAKEYSQVYKKFGNGLWKDKKHEMCMKTVSKLNISKNGPMSIELQKAVTLDQAVVKSDDGEVFEYVDNVVVEDIKSNVADNTADRLKQLVTSAKNKEALDQILSTMSDANKEFVVQEIAMMMDNFEQSANNEKPKEELF